MASVMSAIVLIVMCLFVLVNQTSAEWLTHGGDLTNRRYAYGEVAINRLTVSNMRLRWSFFAGRDISATPAVANGVVYFPSWNGNLYAVSAVNGVQLWRQNLNQLTGILGTGLIANTTVSSSTPTIAGDLLIVGIDGPAVVIAVSRLNGGLVWSTQIDPHPQAQITASGTVFMGEYYVGVSSLENRLPPEQCCTFRGSLVRLDTRTGAIRWQTYMLPDNGGKLGGYAGAPIWGSSPAIDIARRRVYVATGNLYTAPGEVLRCQDEQRNLTGRAAQPDRCSGPDVNFNSVVAVYIDTGRIAWSRKLGGYDVFYTACSNPSSTSCPPGPEMDADFGEAPMLLTSLVSGLPRDVVVVAQKSGFVWSLDRDNGAIIWFSMAGPGREGGGQWGAATEGIRIYTNIANTRRQRYTVAPSGQQTDAGSWVALDINTGRIIWSTPNPSNEAAQGPVTVANGVLFAGSAAPNGPIYALDTATGNILWSTNTGATVYGGASASYGCIFVGSGYTAGQSESYPTWTPGTSLNAYCIV